MHWWDQHVEDLETTDLEEICHQVLDLYAQPVTATKDALVSPPPGAAPKVSRIRFSLVFNTQLSIFKKPVTAKKYKLRFRSQIQKYVRNALFFHNFLFL